MLPAGVPYAIVNNKGRLGELVHQKKATALALTAVNKEDVAGVWHRISQLVTFDL